MNNPERQGKRQNQLYLLLPGTQSEPNKYENVLSMAAYTGYKTIGLSYDNTIGLETACGNNCGCYGPARREVILGGNLSPAVAVQISDTIVNRLYQLLVHLDTMYSNEGWDIFLSNDNQNGIPEFTDFNWDSIVISGHSQGAGHAMMMSKMASVDGILLFDGGNDNCSSGGATYAQWHDLPNMAGERRSFNHDRGGTFSLPPSFIAMAFGSIPADFDLLDVVWPTAVKVATTNQTPPPACTEHGSMAYDGCMPDALFGGMPAMTAADAYLFGFYSNWMCKVGN